MPKKRLTEKEPSATVFVSWESLAVVLKDSGEIKSDENVTQYEYGHNGIFVGVTKQRLNPDD